MKLADERPEDEWFPGTLGTHYAGVFNRQCLVSVKIPALAQALYEMRATWIGGALPWASLTAGQQAKYRAEIEVLVKESK